jgi:hypothetical protein
MRLKAIYFFLLIAFCSDAQPLAIQWQRCLGGTLDEAGFSIKTMFDSGYLVGGIAISNDGDVSGNHSNQTDFWFIKLDTLGDIEWKKCYGGSDVDYLNNSNLTQDSGFVAAGYTGSTNGDVTGMHLPVGATDGWILKCNQTGSIQWEKCVGGSDDDFLFDVIATSSNNYVAIGRAESSDGDVIGRHDSLCFWCADAWLSKYDLSGNLIKSKCFGGNNVDVGYSIAQTYDSGFIFAAGTYSSDGDVSGLHGTDEDFWIVKIDTAWNIEWQKCFGGTGSDVPGDIICTRDSGYIVYGTSTSMDFDVTGNHGSEDAWVIKIDRLGNLIWGKCFGGSDYDNITKIIQKTDSSYSFSGYTESIDGDLVNNPAYYFDVWLADIDSSGQIIWQQCLGGTFDDAAYDLVVDSTNSVFVGATISNNGNVSGNHGSFDIWVAKLSPLGNQISEANPITDFSTSFNPTTNNLLINFYAKGKENMHLQLLDITGRIILQQEIILTPGFNEKIIHVDQHANGIYLVRLESETDFITKKVLMQ